MAMFHFPSDNDYEIGYSQDLERPYEVRFIDRKTKSVFSRFKSRSMKLIENIMRDYDQPVADYNNL